MRIEFDAAKRAVTLAARGLDMAAAGAIFDGRHLTFPDIWFAYGEERVVSVGFRAGRMVVLVWTARSDARPISA